jgi:hypothetical protein
MSATHSIALERQEVTAVEHLAATHPGVSVHLVLIAVVRLGLRLVSGDPSTLANELTAIQQARRARRQARQAQEGGAHG